MTKFTSHSLSNQAHRPTVRSVDRAGRRAFVRYQRSPTPENQRGLFAALRADYNIREGLTDPVPGPTSAPEASRAPRSPRRRTHRQQSREGEADDSDAEPPDPPLSPLPAPYPAPSTWHQDPALDFAWCAPEYDHHAEQLDSLHQLPTVEARPDDEALAAWDWAKCQSFTLAERLQRTVAGMAYAQEIRGCQRYLTFRPTTDGPWAISDTRRCSLRLCPNDALARARSLRWRLNTLAAGILKHGPLLFLTLAAVDADTPRLWKAWGAMRDNVAWRGSNPGVKKPRPPGVLGYFAGLHISRQLRPHLHAVLVANSDQTNRTGVPLRIANLSARPKIGPEELPEIARSSLGISPLAQLWHHACHKVGLSGPSTHVEAVRNPAQALQYIARPASPTLVDDAALPALFDALKDVRTFSVGGIAAEYWADDENDKPGWKGGPAEARRYGWQSDLDAYEITPND